MVKNSLLASGIGKDITVTHFCKSVILIGYLTKIIFTYKILSHSMKLYLIF